MFLKILIGNSILLPKMKNKTGRGNRIFQIFNLEVLHVLMYRAIISKNLLLGIQLLCESSCATKIPKLVNTTLIPVANSELYTFQ